MRMELEAGVSRSLVNSLTFPTFHCVLRVESVICRLVQFMRTCSASVSSRIKQWKTWHVVNPLTLAMLAS